MLGLTLVSPMRAKTPPSPDNPAGFVTAPFVLPQQRYGALTYAGGLFLTAPKVGLFGGVSGIEAEPSADGHGVPFTGVTDQGYVLTFTGELDETGRLVGAGGLVMAPLHDVDGNELVGKHEQDAEDISRVPDAKGWLISFERHHRIMAYVDPFDPDADVIGLNIPADAKKLPANRGIEAIAALPGGTVAVGAEDGRIWLCPPRQEPCPRVHDKGGMGTLFYLTGLHHLPGTRDDMVATYRRPTLRSGYESLIARVAITGGKAVVTELARLPNSVGNVEGISAVVGPNGGYRLYIVTDNNFEENTATRLLAFDWRT